MLEPAPLPEPLPEPLPPLPDPLPLPEPLVPLVPEPDDAVIVSPPVALCDKLSVADADPPLSDPPSDPLGDPLSDSLTDPLAEPDDEPDSMGLTYSAKMFQQQHASHWPLSVEL